ncbi:hypothetical protein ACVBEH_14205 [Roseateles sp. GG27B]
MPNLQRLLQLDAQHWLHLVVPPNHPEGCGRAPMQAQLDSVLPLPFAIKYSVRRGSQPSSAWVYHEGLLKLQVEGPLWPLGGDSGSAVVVAHDDGTAAVATRGHSGSAVVVAHDDGSATLISLYIGGNRSPAYVIPAWQLFDARLHHALPAGARLQPVSL